MANKRLNKPTELNVRQVYFCAFIGYIFLETK